MNSERYLHLLIEGMLLGGHVRVGVEDNPYSTLILTGHPACVVVSPEACHAVPISSLPRVRAARTRARAATPRERAGAVEDALMVVIIAVVMTAILTSPGHRVNYAASSTISHGLSTDASTGQPRVGR